jgi:hypothetical protein
MIKARMRCTGHVEHTGEGRNVDKILVEMLKESDHLKDLDD